MDFDRCHTNAMIQNPYLYVCVSKSAQQCTIVLCRLHNAHRDDACGEQQDRVKDAPCTHSMAPLFLLQRAAHREQSCRGQVHSLRWVSKHRFSRNTGVALCRSCDGPDTVLGDSSAWWLQSMALPERYLLCAPARPPQTHSALFCRSQLQAPPGPKYCNDNTGAPSCEYQPEESMTSGTDAFASARGPGGLRRAS